MNVFNIRRAFKDKKEKGWEKLFWCIDLHDVVIQGKYNKFNEGAEIFPHAQEFFQWARWRKDIVLILWSSSHTEALNDIAMRLFAKGISFNYWNENPEVPSNELINTDKKFYFNILLDDKAGFEGETDWKLVINELKSIGEWDKID